MKQLSIFKYSILSLLLAFGIAGCSSSDDPKYIIDENIQATVAKLNTDAEVIYELLGSQATQDQFTGVEKKENYKLLRFESGKQLAIHDGKLNASIPSLGVEKEEETYYWTVWYKGEKQWLESGGKKVAVSSTLTRESAAPFPILEVNEEGEWAFSVSGTKIEFLDHTGNPVEATGDTKASLFSGLDLSNEKQIEIDLLGDFKITFERNDISFHFVMPEDQLPHFFKYNATAEVEFEANNISSVEPIDLPAGWSAQVDEENKKVAISAPTGDKAQEPTETTIKIKGVDKNNIEIFAEYPVYTLNLAHKDGTIVPLEGNMGDQNGGLIYYDQYTRLHEDIFEEGNPGQMHGNVLQDLYIANDKLYLINQNGGQQGGGDRFMVCNPRNLKLLDSHPFPIKTDEDKEAWPQHIVVVGDKMFVQYAEAGMEVTSGIRVFNLNSKTFAEKSIEGTYGAFTKEGALKGRMTLSRGKIYAALGNAALIIDPENEKVEKTIPFANRQIKGIAKGADNNFHIALSGEYEGEGWGAQLVSNPQMVGIDHDGKIIYTHSFDENVKFPIATWTPSINMGASFTKPHIYFLNSDDFSIKTASRFNYETKTTELDFIDAPNDQPIYGYMGVNPKTEDLFMGTSVYYTSTTIFRFTVDKETDKVKVAEEYDFSAASPAGINFGYRFTDEFINR